MKKQIKGKNKNLKPFILTVGIVTILFSFICLIFSIIANLKYYAKIDVASSKIIYTSAFPVGILSFVSLVLLIIFTIASKLNPKSNLGLNSKLIIITSIVLISLAFIVSIVGVVWIINEDLFGKDKKLVPCFLWLASGILSLPVGILSFISFAKIKIKKSK